MRIDPPRARRRLLPPALCCVLAVAGGTAGAADEPPAQAPSPWVLLPTFSHSPKLGASVDGNGALLFKMGYPW